MSIVKMSAEDVARLFGPPVPNSPLWRTFTAGSTGGYNYHPPVPVVNPWSLPAPVVAPPFPGETGPAPVAAPAPMPAHEAGRALDLVAGNRPLPVREKPVRVPPPLPARSYGAMLRNEWSPFGAL